MRTEQETRELAKELEKLTGFIGDFGTDNELHSKDVQCACNITDVLGWVLGEIETEHFRSDAYINLVHLNTVARCIENRTGNKLKDYK